MERLSADKVAGFAKDLRVTLRIAGSCHNSVGFLTTKERPSGAAALAYVDRLTARFGHRVRDVTYWRLA